MANTSSVVLTQRERPAIAKLLHYSTVSETRECLWGMLFAIPWLLGLLIFTLGPILASLYLSLTKYDVISAPQFLGIENYHRALFRR